LGTAGSVVLDRDGYTMYDLKEKVMKSSLAAQAGDGLNTTADDEMTALHIANFVDAIRTGAALRQPIEEGAKSVLLGHLGNIAQSTGRALRIDAASGRITGDEEAMKLCSASTPRAGRRSSEPVTAVLDPDRFFDPDPAVRRVARECMKQRAGCPSSRPTVT